MRKVKAYLRGGLGNQCFIYATARALALRSGAELELDLGCFADDKMYRREYRLGFFKCIGSILPIDAKPIRFAKAIRRKLLTRFKSNGIGNYRCDYYPYTYNPLPTDWQGTLALDGYWQSENYYYGERSTLLDDFQLKDESALNGDVIAEMMCASSCPVFVHMRSYGEVSAGAGAVPVGTTFYEKAVVSLRERIGSGMTLFLFSDNLPWALERIRIVNAASGLELVPVESSRNVSIPGEVRDFTLMQMCHHGIVANSSFSRFAAWLGEQRNIAAGRSPIYVHNSRKKNGYCPERWIRIDAD